MSPFQLGQNVNIIAPLQLIRCLLFHIVLDFQCDFASAFWEISIFFVGFLSYQGCFLKIDELFLAIVKKFDTFVRRNGSSLRAFVSV